MNYTDNLHHEYAQCDKMIKHGLNAIKALELQEKHKPFLILSEEHKEKKEQIKRDLDILYSNRKHIKHEIARYYKNLNKK